MKKTTLFALLFCFCMAAFSQSKINNNWYFNAGDAVGVTFNPSGIPSVVNDSQANTLGPSASVSDNNGNLLFYLDGTNIRNGNHSTIGTIDTASEVLIVPSFNNSNEYYLFYALQDDNINANDGYNFAIINAPDGNNVSILSNNGFLRDENGQQYTKFRQSAKRIAAYHHQDSNTIWIMVLSINKVLTYRLDSNGLNTSPQNVSPFITFDSLPIRRGSLKVSPDGTKIAMSIRFFSVSLGNDAMLADFDASTGVISNPIAISISNVHDLEFSPDSQSLYMRGSTLQVSKNLQQNKNSIPPSALYLYPITPITKNFNNTPVQILSGLTGFGQIQLGPDDKIYFNNFAFHDNAYLGVIDNPNDLVANLNIDDEFLLISGTSSHEEASIPDRVIDLNNVSYPIVLTQAAPSQALRFPLKVRLDMDKNDNLYINFSNGPLNNQTFLNPQHPGLSYLGNVISPPFERIAIKINTSLQIDFQEAEGLFIGPTDDLSNFYVSSGSFANNMTKYSSTNNPLWSILNTNLTVNSFLHNDNKHYMNGNNVMYKVNSTNGNVESTLSVPNNFSLGKFRSKTTNHIYDFQSNNNQFTVTKYVININSIDFVESSTYNFSSPVSPSFLYDWIGFNELTNKFYIFNPHGSELFVLDENTNLETIINVPLSSNTGANVQTNFNSSLNRYVIFEQDRVHTLIEDGNHNLNTLISNTPFYETIDFPYITFSLKQHPSNIVQDSNGLVYFSIAATDTLGIYSAKIFRINPNTGQLVSRSVEQAVKEVSIIEKEVALSVYPNPFDSQLTIKQNQENTISKIIILDKLGNVLLSQNNEGLSKSIKLNTSKLNRGIYFIKTYFTNGKTEVKQIIKE